MGGGGGCFVSWHGWTLLLGSSQRQQRSRDGPWCERRVGDMGREGLGIKLQLKDEAEHEG
eukprot:213090-Chlamydomonas_euryale.AAC.1